MFLPVIVKGQTTGISLLPPIDDLMYAPKRDHENKLKATASDLVELYDQYKVECYNDSSWYHFHGPTMYGDIGNGLPDPVRCVKMDCKPTPGQLWQYKEYTSDYGWHRPEATFEGFVEFLRHK